jgi:hypothetical protein
MKLKIFRLSKRQKIVISAILMTLLFVITTPAANIIFKRYYLIPLMGLFGYLLTLWSLWEGMTKLKAIILMVLPTLFCLGYTSFYFTLDQEYRDIIRVPAVLAFGFVFYTMLLSQNVFNVAAVRTIPLYRAASTASFVFTLITAFLLFGVLFTFRFPFYWNLVGVFLISLPLIIQFLWTIEMEKVDNVTLSYSIILSFIMAQFALSLSFWPVIALIWGIFLTTGMYLILGVVTEHLRERLSGKLIGEYLGVGVLVMLFSLLATSWTG